jgi:hypothetical protein
MISGTSSSAPKRKWHNGIRRTPRGGLENIREFAAEASDPEGNTPVYVSIDEAIRRLRLTENDQTAGQGEDGGIR